MADCEHCWHGKGFMLMSYPPQWDEVCCHCGAVERRSAKPPWEGHGPHHPGRPIPWSQVTFLGSGGPDNG